MSVCNITKTWNLPSPQNLIAISILKCPFQIIFNIKRCQPHLIQHNNILYYLWVYYTIFHIQYTTFLAKGCSICQEGKGEQQEVNTIMCQRGKNRLMGLRALKNTQ